MHSLIKYIIGTVRYKVISHNPSRASGMLMSEFQGNAFDVKVTGNDTFEFTSYSVMSKRIINYLSEHGYEYSVLEKNGLYTFVKYKIKHPGLVLGLFIAIISFVLQSRIVWDITVTGNRTASEEEIISTLEEAGFAMGKRYEKEKLSEICNRFIILNDRFSRISINMSGKCAFVEVAERRKKSDGGLPMSENGLVAEKDCIIERPEVFSGTAIVGAGETVEKGSLLIIPVEKGTADIEYFTGASGRVYAKVYESFAVFVPYNQTSSYLSEKVGGSVTYSFLGHSLKLENPLKKSDKSGLCTVKQGKLSLSESITLPIRYKEKSLYNYKTEAIRLSSAETENQAYEIIYQKLAESLSDAEILSSSFEKEETDDGIILKCTVECLRNVAVLP
ncbi:MAG: sporulation protein YqfD [Clostridia bacterium]|nr:sporulation protein YqfD [Clostridia bacterium]